MSLRQEWAAFLAGMGERQRIDAVRWAYVLDFVDRALTGPVTVERVHWSGDPSRCHKCGFAPTACDAEDCPQK